MPTYSGLLDSGIGRQAQAVRSYDAGSEHEFQLYQREVQGARSRKRCDS
jgi:hypothetical protein